MEDLNYNSESFGDQQLGAKINQALEEYNNIFKKIKGTGKDFNQILNNDYSYKTPSKYNYNFTRNKPPILSLKNDYSYQNSFKRNFNKSYILDSKFKNVDTNDLLEEFKETLEKSQIIKDDLINDNFRYKLHKKNNNKKYDYLDKDKFNFYTNLHSSKRLKGNFYEEEKSSTSNGTLSLEYKHKKLENMKKNKKSKISKKKEKKEKKDAGKNEREEKILEDEGKTLINKYQEIRKDNRILEIEINNYKKLANKYINFGNNYKYKFNNKYSQNTINQLEQSLHQNIQNNCYLIDTILKIKNENQILSSKIKSLSKMMDLDLQKIEKRNRKNAEIQITNEENEQKIINLQDKKQSLLHELENQNIILLKLKNKEDNLNLLNESNKKAINDKEEHILKLKNTINKYNIYKDNSRLNNSFSNNNIKQYEDKINNLKLEINNLNLTKQKFLVSNSDLQNQLLVLNPNNFDNNKRMKLNEKLSELKKENEEKKISLKERENQLEIIKTEINNLTLNKKNNNQLQDIQKEKINNLINNIENPNSINFLLF